MPLLAGQLCLLSHEWLWEGTLKEDRHTSYPLVMHVLLQFIFPCTKSNKTPFVIPTRQPTFQNQNGPTTQ